MPWTWSQSKGLLTGPAGTKIAQGYAGSGAGINNPNMQDIPNVGPIPQGTWQIGPLEASHDTLGTNVMALTPAEGTDAFGRSAFYCHGDTASRDESASHGCIVLPLWARMQMADSTDKVLEVTA